MKYKQRTKAAVYIRLASYDGNEIAQQINSLLRMVDRNDESLVGVYADNGAAGTTLERPEFQRMLGDAKGGRFTKLYVRDLARVSRNEQQLQTALEQLHIDGIAIIARDNPDGPRLVVT